MDGGNIEKCISLHCAWSFGIYVNRGHDVTILRNACVRELQREELKETVLWSADSAHSLFYILRFLTQSHCFASKAK
jgi:hypothetical protein